MRQLGRRDAAVVVLAVGVGVAVAVLSVPSGVVPSSAFATVPLVASGLCRVRATLYAALAGVAAAVVVGGIDEGFGDRSQLERVAVVAVAGLVAVTLARLRARVIDEGG